MNESTPQEEGLITYSHLHQVEERHRPPNLHVLEQLLQGQSPVLTLTASDQAAVDRQLWSLCKLCEEFGWTPVITELALISDARLRSPIRDPHFTSFIKLAVPASAAVAQNYLEALRFMKTPSAGGVQIVPHPTLFDAETGLVLIRCAGVAPTVGDGEARAGDAGEAGGETFITATRESFVLHKQDDIRKSERDLVGQVKLFARRFMQLLAARRDLQPAFDVLRKTTLIVLPLLRPHRTTDVMADGAVNVEDLPGSPAGALLMFLAANEAPRRVTELVRAMSLLFAEAGMRESYTTLDLELEEKRALESYRELLQVFGHGVANLMKAAGLVSLRERSLKFERLPSPEVKNALDLLWPVWGIADLSRIATMQTGVLRDEWLTPRARPYIGDDDYLTGDVTSVMPSREIRLARTRSLVLAFVDALCTPQRRAAPRVMWCGMAVDSGEASHLRARALWPFHDDDYLSGTTLVTLGLFELLSNAVNYLRDSGLHVDDRWLDISGTVDENDTMLLTIEHAVTQGEWLDYRRSYTGGPRSATIDKIRATVESKLRSERGPIVATEPFIATDREWTIRAHWAFSWGCARWQKPVPATGRMFGRKGS